MAIFSTAKFFRYTVLTTAEPNVAGSHCTRFPINCTYHNFSYRRHSNLNDS